MTVFREFYVKTATMESNSFLFKKTSLMIAIVAK